MKKVDIKWYGLLDKITLDDAHKSYEINGLAVEVYAGRAITVVKEGET